MTNTMKGALIYFLGSFGTAAALYTMSACTVPSGLVIEDGQDLANAIIQERRAWNHGRRYFCDPNELYRAYQGYVAIREYWEDNCSGYTHGERADLCERWYPEWVQYHYAYMNRVDYCE